MSEIRGVIGISSGVLARYGETWASLLGMHCPEGWTVVPVRGGSIAENRNGIAERSLAAGAAWTFYADDDQIFQPHTLKQLLSHDKDIVSGLYLQREPPFKPLVGDREDERGYWFSRLLRPFDSGLKESLTVPGGCLLVRNVVFEALDKPWWRLGQLEGAEDKWCDDVDFCRRARAKGFTIHCDYELTCGHEMIVSVWPHRKPDGSWVTLITQGENILCEFPAAFHALEANGAHTPLGLRAERA